MTYLNIVNKVLRKLRENTATTVIETEYTQLIGDFVNDAIQTVENAWDWSALRQDITLTTTANEAKYSLVGFGVRGEVMSVYNTTNKHELVQRSKDYIENKLTLQPTFVGTPRNYCLQGVDANGDSKLVLFPKPDKAYNISCSVIKRNVELVNDSDVTYLPVQPIVQLAFAYALRERGETGGQGAMEQIAVAKEDLSSAIALDAGINSDELIFGVI